MDPYSLNNAPGSFRRLSISFCRNLDAIPLSCGLSVRVAEEQTNPSRPPTTANTLKPIRCRQWTVRQHLACPDRSSDRGQRFKRTVPEREARKHCSRHARKRSAAPQSAGIQPPPHHLTPVRNLTRCWVKIVVRKRAGALQSLLHCDRVCLFHRLPSVKSPYRPRPVTPYYWKTALTRTDVSNRSTMPASRLQTVCGKIFAERLRASHPSVGSGKHPTAASGDHGRVPVSNHH
jgi:hypothetical protein